MSNYDQHVRDRHFMMCHEHRHMLWRMLDHAQRENIKHLQALRLEGDSYQGIKRMTPQQRERMNNIAQDYIINDLLLRGVTANGGGSN